VGGAGTGGGVKLAAVIAAYQAAPWVGGVARETTRYIPEVLVVDDGSDDDTAARARSADVEVVSLTSNQGKGAALRHGFGHVFGSGFDAALTLDADGQHLPGEIPKLIAAWRDGADLVLGSRDHAFGEMSTVRRNSNRMSSRLISFAAGRRFRDVQTGFRIYSRDLIDATGFPESRFDAESAVVVRASRHGFRIDTVPILLGFVDGRRTSHYRPVVDSLRIARSVVRARLEFVLRRRDIRQSAKPALPGSD
jgi:glycosyltransferase involved in cell wall biosynthesis